MDPSQTEYERTFSTDAEDSGKQLDRHGILDAWLGKLRQQYKLSGDPALIHIAPTLVREIFSYILNDGILCEESKLLDVDFSSHGLEQVMLEVRVLRAEILRNLGGDKNFSNRDYVIGFFDAFLVRVASRSTQDRNLKSWVSMDRSHSSGRSNIKDSGYSRETSVQRDIAGAIIADLETHLPEWENILNEGSNFLADASKLFATSMDYDETIANVASLATGELADWCIIDALDESDEFKRAAVCHRDSSLRFLTDELRENYGPQPDTRGVPSHVLRNRQTLLIPLVNDSHYAATARSPRHEEILRKLGSRSYMCVPLTARGNFIGAITLVSNHKTYSAADVVFAEEFCSRAALAIDNSIQFLRTQKAIAMRDVFLGIVSHDLKNPLQAIDMSANLLLRQKAPNPERAIKHAITIRSAAKRMSRLIEDLLNLSKFEAGKFSIESKSERLTQIFEEIQQSFKPIASAKAVNFICSAPDDVFIYCDRDRLIQAISNLVSNAIKFTPAGGEVYLGGELNKHGSLHSKSKSVVISIEDSGCGIAPEAIPHVFDRYWQARSAEAKQGTGLGLSIVKMMIEAHGGTVRAESVPGKGSRFVLELSQYPENQNAGF